MSARLFLTAFLVASLSLAAPLLAANEVFHLLPEDALGFAVLQRPGALDAKIQDLAKRLNLPPLGVLALAKEYLGIREGLDEKRDLAILFLPRASEVFPTIVVLVPVTDYAKFLKPLKPEAQGDGLSKIRILGTTAWARQITGCAVITDASGRETLAKMRVVRPKIPPSMFVWQHWLADHDLGVVILPPGVKRFSAMAQQGIQFLKEPGSADSTAMKMIGGRLDVAAQFLRTAEKEASAFGLFAQLDQKDAIRVVGRAMLVAGGEWSRLASDPLADEDPLAGLPGGPFAIAAAVRCRRGVDALHQAFLEMTRSMYRALGLDDEQIDKGVQRARETMQGVRTWAMIRGGDRIKSDYSGALTVVTVEDSKAYMANYAESERRYAEAMKAAKSARLRFAELEKTQIAGTPALQFTMDVPQPPGASADNPANRTGPRFFGPRGNVLGWVVPADEHRVVIGYVSEEYIQKAMETIRRGKRGLSSDPQVATVARLLPRRAPAVVYVSPSGVIDWMTGSSGASENRRPAFLSGFPATPPIAAALTATPEELRADLVLPAELVKALGPYAAGFLASGRPASQ